MIVRCQVSRWGQSRKTTKKWQFWILRSPGISEHRNLFAVRSPKCAPTCTFSNDTLFDPIWCCWAELRNRNHISDCQKMRLEKWKSDKREFLGWFLTFWVNLIRRIWILPKILTSSQRLPEKRAPITVSNSAAQRLLMRARSVSLNARSAFVLGYF